MNLALWNLTNADVENDATDTGKSACYILRWVSTHGEKGPWSDAVSAYIA